MATSDELHDLADDAVCADRGLVAMEPLRLGGCMRTWCFLTWFFIFDQ